MTGSMDVLSDAEVEALRAAIAGMAENTEENLRADFGDGEFPVVEDYLNDAEHAFQRELPSEGTLRDLAAMAEDLEPETRSALAKLGVLGSRWANVHAPDCTVTRWRERALIDPMDEDVRRGVIAEWDEGGDQEAECCDCGLAS